MNIKHRYNFLATTDWIKTNENMSMNTSTDLCVVI